MQNTASPTNTSSCASPADRTAAAGRLYKENITEAEILAILDDWIGAWAREREANEGFGDYAIRRGIVLPVLDAPRDFWAA